MNEVNLRAFYWMKILCTIAFIYMSKQICMIIFFCSDLYSNKICITIWLFFGTFTHILCTVRCCLRTLTRKQWLALSGVERLMKQQSSWLVGGVSNQNPRLSYKADIWCLWKSSENNPGASGMAPHRPTHGVS